MVLARCHFSRGVRSLPSSIIFFMVGLQASKPFSALPLKAPGQTSRPIPRRSRALPHRAILFALVPREPSPLVAHPRHVPISPRSLSLLGTTSQFLPSVALRVAHILHPSSLPWGKDTYSWPSSPWQTHVERPIAGQEHVPVTLSFAPNFPLLRNRFHCSPDTHLRSDPHSSKRFDGGTPLSTCEILENDGRQLADLGLECTVNLD